MKYQQFLKILDKKLQNYFKQYENYVYCQKGCADCCKCGDYPLSQLEFEYIMQGYIELKDEDKRIIKNNIKLMKKGGVCPFLKNNLCLIYPYRPIVCRVHGLAYKGIKAVILPYCSNNNKNFSSVYKDSEILIEPVFENLDTPSLLHTFNYGEIRTMYDWFKVNNY